MCSVSALCNDISYPQALMNELLLLQFKNVLLRAVLIFFNVVL